MDHSRPRCARRGTTLLELVVVASILATLLAVSLPPLARWRARWQARRARDDVAMLFTAARWRAQVSGRAVVVSLDTAAALVRAEQPAWRLVRPVGAAYGAQLRASRLTLTYRPDGLAAGVANLTAVVQVGAIAESLRVSRLGRVR